MQKKLVAAAVAGALGIPAVALAQNATVNMYGRLYMEYGFVSQGQGNTAPGAVPLVPATIVDRVDADHIQTGGSAIGFRGEEKLGGGMSAWFQCESTADPRGVGQNGFCSRDTALGLKGNFGNVFMGQWGTPFKRARVYTGSGDTGHFGTSGLLTGHSTTTLDGAQPQMFARRQANLIGYDSPVFGGFQVMGGFTTTNNSTGRSELSANQKPRLWGVGAIYRNGPLKLTAAYEKHKDHLGAVAGAAPVGPVAIGGFVGNEHGWLVGGEYTFANKLKLGGMWTRQTWDTTGVVGAPAGFKGSSNVSAWQIGMEWNISGPHSIAAAYTTAGDVKGNGIAQPGGLRPAAVAGGSTGAKMYQIRYLHALSKRTEIGLGYNHVKNDTFAGYNLNGSGANGGGGGAAAGGNGFGGKHSVFAFTMDHKF